MTRLKPVIWTKGTFLSPQHLQIQDRFLEDVLHFQLDALSFRPWGFRSLQIGQEALAAGLFSIAAASGPTAFSSIFRRRTARLPRKFLPTVSMRIKLRSTFFWRCRTIATAAST